MKMKSFIGNEDAVSPVIGVILMVAITVILAAVIAAFVLGFGADQQTAPQASWSVNDNTTTYTTDGQWVDIVTFRHTGGESVDIDTLRIVIDNTSTLGDSEDTVEFRTANGETILRAGDIVTLEVRLTANDPPETGTIAERGDEVRLIWEEGEDSSILRTFELTGDLEYDIPTP